MKTDYENIIDFCEAEIVTGKTSYVEVKEYKRHYQILFIGIRHSVDIYKPQGADAHDIDAAATYGHSHTPYRELPIWPNLAGMLGLKPAWVACADRLPDTTDDYIVALSDGSITVAAFLTLAPCGDFGAFKRNWWQKDGREVDAIHWHHLPPR